VSSLFRHIRAGAGRAAFEAEKLRRISAVQSAIKSLKVDVDKAVYQTGYVAQSLYSQGLVDQPDLKQACERLAALQAQVVAREREIESIRAEEYVDPTVLSTPQYGRVCPNGHGPISLPNNFCQTCGARAIEIAPPTPAGAAFCQNCGSSLAAGVRFCATCGQPAPQPEPPARTKVVSPGSCRSCGAVLVPDSLFCSECGQRVFSETPTQPASSVPEEGYEGEEQPSEPAAPEDSPEMALLPPQELQTGTEAKVEVAADDEERPTESDALSDERQEELSAADNDSETGQSEEDMADEIETIAACPMCHSPLLPDAIFCAECGHRVAEA